MAPLQNLHIRIKFTTLSPLLDPPSFDLSYFTTFTTQDATDVAALVSNIHTSLTTIPSGGANTPAQWLSSTLSRAVNGVLYDVYDVSSHLNGSPAGSPYLIANYQLSSTTSSTPMPEQVAAVITLQAPYGTDVEFLPGSRPRARDRGRIYFGPLAGQACSLEATTNRTIVNAAPRTDLTRWIKSICVYTSPPHTVVWNLAVWSRKNATMKSLQECWVDDRPDVMRRRAGLAGAKTIQALP